MKKQNLHFYIVQHFFSLAFRNGQVYLSEDNALHSISERVQFRTKSSILLNKIKKSAFFLGTKSFIPKEHDIYCAKCYEDKFATKCIKCSKVGYYANFLKLGIMFNYRFNQFWCISANIAYKVTNIWRPNEDYSIVPLTSACSTCQREKV